MRDLERAVIRRIKEVIDIDELRMGHVDGPWKDFTQKFI